MATALHGFVPGPEDIPSDFRIGTDRKNRVRKIVPNLQPWRLSCSLTARSVLELPAGTIAATRTRVGDQLSFDRREAES